MWSHQVPLVRKRGDKVAQWDREKGGEKVQCWAKTG